jgi:hypothetical protein
LSIVACFGLGGRNVANGLEQAPVVEPVDPFQCGELDSFQIAPRSAAERVNDNETARVID